jgi:putative ABC transport system permease protein
MKAFMFFSHLLRDVRSQKTRTVLTVFGIVWGTVSIVLLLGFGVGMGRQMSKNMHGMGEGIIILWPARTSISYQGLNKGRALRFLEEDASLLEREVPQVASLSAEYSRWNVTLRKDRNSYSAMVRGVYPVYGEMRNIIPERGGRFIDPLDLESKKRVVFLGNKIHEELFKSEAAVGRYVMINAIPFLVVGVLREKKQDSSYGSRDEVSAVIPASTFSSVFGTKYVNNIIVKGHDPRENEALKKRVIQVFAKKYKFHPDDKEAVWVWDVAEMQKMVQTIMLGFNLFLGIVGAFTLIVGGIGVSNIMNVVVEERTREIGLKMALGAKKRYVLSQFLFETLLITLIGGAIGLALSAGIIAVFPESSISEEIGQPTFSLQVALITTAFSGYWFCGLRGPPGNRPNQSSLRSKNWPFGPFVLPGIKHRGNV